MTRDLEGILGGVVGELRVLGEVVKSLGVHEDSSSAVPVDGGTSSGVGTSPAGTGGVGAHTVEAATDTPRADSSAGRVGVPIAGECDRS